MQSTLQVLTSLRSTEKRLPIPGVVEVNGLDFNVSVKGILVEQDSTANVVGEVKVIREATVLEVLDRNVLFNGTLLCLVQFQDSRSAGVSAQVNGWVHCCRSTLAWGNFFLTAERDPLRSPQTSRPNQGCPSKRHGQHHHNPSEFPRQLRQTAQDGRFIATSACYEGTHEVRQPF